MSTARAGPLSDRSQSQTFEQKIVEVNIRNESVRRASAKPRGVCTYRKRLPRYVPRLGE